MSSNHSVIGSAKKKIKYTNASMLTTIAIKARICSPRDQFRRIAEKTTKSEPKLQAVEFIADSSPLSIVKAGITIARRREKLCTTS
jgi:hypothetical protein